MIRLLALLVIGCAPALPHPDVSALLGTVPTRFGPCGSVALPDQIVTAAHCAPTWAQPEILSDVAAFPFDAPGRSAVLRATGPIPGERIWIETPRAEGWATCERISYSWRAAIISWPGVRGDSGGSAWSADGELLCILTGAVADGRSFCELIPTERKPNDQ